MALTEARKRANAKYNAKAYDTFLVRFPKGNKAKAEAHAKDHGESLNGFINRAIDEAMQRDEESMNEI